MNPTDAQPRPGVPAPNRLRRGVKLAALAALALSLVAILGVAGLLAASLPRRDGTLTLAGLGAELTIERDALGVVTVSAKDRRDVAFATGYVHAQDRYFQMDLARRYAAGELSELFGAPALASDRRARVHRFRDVARRSVARLSRQDQALLDAYTGGVNAGLDDLKARPFEYLLLRLKPAPWRAEDTALVILSMFMNLQDTGEHEAKLGLMHEELAPAL